MRATAEPETMASQGTGAAGGGSEGEGKREELCEGFAALDQAAKDRFWELEKQIEDQTVSSSDQLGRQRE